MVCEILLKFAVKAMQLQPKTQRTMCMEAEDSKPDQFRVETRVELGLDFYFQHRDYNT